MYAIGEDQVVRPFVHPLEFQRADQIVGRLHRPPAAGKNDAQHFQRTRIGGVRGFDVGHRPFHCDPGHFLGLVHSAGTPQGTGIAVIARNRIRVCRA